MQETPSRSMEEVIRSDGRYPPEAFAFLHEGLNRSVEKTHGPDVAIAPDASRHVTGRQLCLALKDQAIERWGLLARTVLTKWNIHGTIDFGRMVYLLIENGYMRKTDEDSIDDFRDVFDFDEAFDVSVNFDLKE